MLRDVIHLLACPHGGHELQLDGTTVGCTAGHRFDVARQGYVNLSTSARHAANADTAAMVASRVAFVARGHQRPLSAALADAAAVALDGAARDGEPGPGRPAAIVDVGAGPGHHLAAVLDRLPHAVGLAVDLSTAAARRAARCHPRAGAVTGDLWEGLPVRDHVADLVLDVFAPRAADEFARILRADGALIVASAEPEHLQELVGPLGLLAVDPHKTERREASLRGRFVEIARTEVRSTTTLGPDDVRLLAAMGPSAHHLDDDRLAAAVAALPDEVEVTTAATVTTHRPLP